VRERLERSDSKRKALYTIKLTPPTHRFSHHSRVSLYVTVSPDGVDSEETTASIRFACSGTYVDKKKRKARKSVSMEAKRLDALKARARVREARFDRDTGRNVTEGGISCRGIDAPRPDDEITDVVMLHYYSGRCRRFGSEAVWTDEEIAGIQRELIGRGINARIIIPDFPGHGRTRGCAQSSKPEYSSFVGEGGSVETVSHVFDHFGVTNRVVLFGFDCGGGVGKSFAQKYPERIKGLVVHNPSYREGTEEVKGEGRGWIRGKKVDVIWTEVRVAGAKRQQKQHATYCPRN